LELGAAEIATNFNDFCRTLRVKRAFEKNRARTSHAGRRKNTAERIMWRDLSRALRALWRIPGESSGSYRPDLHYMRGPGPKWHAKHAGFVATTPPAAKAPGPALHTIAERRA
jgi:hypothetical protein